MSRSECKKAEGGEDGGTHRRHGCLGCGCGALHTQRDVVSRRGQVHVEGGQVTLGGAQGVVPARGTQKSQKLDVSICRSEQTYLLAT